MATRLADPGSLPSVYSAAAAGDVIELASGEYRYQVNHNKPVTLRSASGLGAVMVGDQRPERRGYPAVYVTSVGGWKVELVKLANPIGDGIKVQGAQDGRVYRALFERCAMQGILVQAARNVDVLENEFAWCGNDILLDPHTDRPGTGLHSIYYGGNSTPTYGGLVAFNWVHDSQNGSPIQVGPTPNGTRVWKNTVQRLHGPAKYAEGLLGIVVFNDFSGAHDIIVEENIVEDMPGFGYGSRGWGTARSLATFRRNAARRCGLVGGSPFYGNVAWSQEVKYGTQSWGTFQTMYDALPDWKLAVPQPVPAGDSPLVGLAADGSTLGAFGPASVPVPVPTDSLPLTVLSETATTVTVGWTPPAGAVGYRFRRNGGKWSHTWDGSLSSTRFAKPYDKIEVEALSVLYRGDLP